MNRETNFGKCLLSERNNGNKGPERKGREKKMNFSTLPSGKLRFVGKPKQVFRESFFRRLKTFYSNRRLRSSMDECVSIEVPFNRP